MTRPLKLRSLVAGLALLAGAAAASCSGDSKKSPPPAAAAGASSMAESIQCGASSCNPVILVKGIDPIAACCVGTDGCGLDSSFLAQYGTGFAETCQPKHQPGELGHGCPASPELKVPNAAFTIPSLPGCCRTETQTCGYQLDKLGGVFDVGLGCIDSSPFLDGGTAATCDPEGTAGAGP